MATAKLATLVVRTLAKPISNRLKQQAVSHPTFRNLCINIAQSTYRAEVQLRTNLLGEPAKTIRPLAENKAIETGANTLAEGFLFTVAACLILGETWRSSRNETKRRDAVQDKLEEMTSRVKDLSESLENTKQQLEDQVSHERERTDQLNRVLQSVVDIGLQSGLGELGDSSVKILRMQLEPLINNPRTPSRPDQDSPPSTERTDTDTN